VNVIIAELLKETTLIIDDVSFSENESSQIYLYLQQGLKFKFIGGPHSKEKMLRGLQFNRKKLLWATISKESPQKKLNLMKIYIFCHFWGCSRAVQMYLAGRVFETPDLHHHFLS
jgi:hypothetical protein